MRLAVLITCFNRKATTLRGLSALRSALRLIPELAYTIFLVDDLSPDRTGEAVRSAHPDVHVIEGNGSLFWNRGMCLAFTTARSFGSFDAYLLFNDDLLVTELGVMGAFEDFRHCNLRKPTILAASTTSGDGREITYTGYRSASKIRPRAFTEVIPNGTLTSIDVFNGNFVLVPGPFFERVNGLDPGFLHTLGDIDLGITAKAGGLDIMLARLPVGSCEKNIQFDSGFRAASFLKRLAMLNHPRFRSHDFLYFVRKHRPTVLLPLFFLTFHFKRLLKLLVG